MREQAVAEAESLLRESGWQLAGTNQKGETMWSDPAGQGNRTGEKVEAVRLVNKDGGEPTVIKQTRCGPASWDYSLMEASVIQRQRDRASKERVVRTVVTG